MDGRLDSCCALCGPLETRKTCIRNRVEMESNALYGGCRCRALGSRDLADVPNFSFTSCLGLGSPVMTGSAQREVARGASRADGAGGGGYFVTID